MTVSFFVYLPVRFKQSAQLFIIRRLFLGVFGREIIAAFPKKLYPQMSGAVERAGIYVSEIKGQRVAYQIYHC